MEKYSEETSDDVGRDFVRNMLATYNLYAIPIKVSSHKTPDLELPVSSQRILIEVKSKEDDNQLRDLLNSPAGTSLEYRLSAIENVLKRAWHQIKEFPERTAKDFTVIWLLGAVPGRTALMRPAAMSVLYGLQQIDARTNDGVLYDKECFFFGNSFFFRRKELDAVVLHDDRHITLCLNPFADRRSEFRATPFAEVFRCELSITDPQERERSGECFIADCSLSRKNVNAVVRYLKEKYGLANVTIYQFGFVNCPVSING
jgi:hypothetical protein